VVARALSLKLSSLSSKKQAERSKSTEKVGRPRKLRSTQLTPDIADVPLGQVRSNLGIIAQDPILLSGTLRHNLDLEGKYDDQALYDALRQVQLITSVDDPGSSSSTISDSGTTVVEPATPGGGVAPNNVFTNLDSEIKSGGEK